jgi:hypothetical protein
MLLRLGPRGAKTVGLFVLLQTLSNGRIRLAVWWQNIFGFFWQARTCGSMSLRLGRKPEARAALEQAR